MYSHHVPGLGVSDHGRHPPRATSGMTPWSFRGELARDARRGRRGGGGGHVPVEMHTRLLVLVVDNTVRAVKAG